MATSHWPARWPAPPGQASSAESDIEWIFEDPKSRALLAQIDQVAPSDASVLVIGETGTGKELIARYIHSRSARRNGPFVALNCGAFSEALVDDELFGHENGAFVGAFGAQPGWFEAANHGTLFLDEINDLPLAIQTKMLRVLQEREVVRLGARKGIPIDVRVLAASNVRLEPLIAAARMRQDLYYRLNVVSLEIAPLQQRPGDIVPLAHFFVELYSRKLGYPRARFTPAAEDALVGYAWPGNVRELENTIHRALLLGDSALIDAADLRLPDAHGRPPEAGPVAAPATDLSSGARRQTLARHAPEATAAPEAAEASTRADGIGSSPELGTALGLGLDAAANAPNPDAPNTLALPNTPESQLRRALRQMLAQEEGRLQQRVEDVLYREAFRHAHYNQVQTAALLGVSRNVVRARLVRLGELAAAPVRMSPPLASGAPEDLSKEHP